MIRKFKYKRGVLQNQITIIYYMKEQTLDQALQQDSVPTVLHPTVMTEEFMSVYRQALQYSNLQIDSHLKYRNVQIYQNEHIHELYTDIDSSLPHLVLLHGYGGTSLTFIRTFQHLSRHFQVHALDTFGVGLSSRGKWKDEMTAEQAGEYYIDALQEWRKKLGLKVFILAGHSFGGYISTLYLQKYPMRVKQLILLSPAGTATFTEEAIRERESKSKFFFCVAEKFYNMNIRPSRIMNACWIGNKFIDRILKNRLKLPEEEQQVWKKYLKHICKTEESSEKGFYTLFSWPLQPVRSIQNILNAIKPKIKIDFFYGDSDWMQPEGAKRLATVYQNMKVHEIKDAGHQLIFDNPTMVADKIKQAIL